MHSWCMNPLFYNIFHLMENFFLRDMFADVNRAIEFD